MSVDFDEKTWLEVQIELTQEKIKRLQEEFNAPEIYVAIEHRNLARYQGQLHEISPKKITRNIVQCKNCKDIVESTHRHDFARCKCNSIFTDGGTDYQRCGWPSGDVHDWIEFDQLQFVDPKS